MSRFVLSQKNKRRLRALTLIELTISLAITAVLSTAVYGLVAATANTGTFLDAQTQGLAELDLAIRRIAYNIRTTPTPPTWTSAGNYNVLAITKTGVGVIDYYVDTNGNLVEADPRYEVNAQPNVLVHGITSPGFFCTQGGGTATQTNTTFTVTLTLPADRTITRTVTVALRDTSSTTTISS